MKPVRVAKLTFNGTLLTKNVHLLSSSHLTLNASRSNISPIGSPHPPSSH